MLSSMTKDMMAMQANAVRAVQEQSGRHERINTLIRQTTIPAETKTVRVKVTTVPAETADEETEEQRTSRWTKAGMNRIRRVAARQGLRVVKSRRRDPRAVDYDRYWVVQGNIAVEGGEHGLTFFELKNWLREG